jgi:hypothetical protein
VSSVLARTVGPARPILRGATYRGDGQHPRRYTDPRPFVPATGPDHCPRRAGRSPGRTPVRRTVAGGQGVASPVLCQNVMRDLDQVSLRGEAARRYSCDQPTGDSVPSDRGVEPPHGGGIVGWRTLAQTLVWPVVSEMAEADQEQCGRVTRGKSASGRCIQRMMISVSA